MALLEGKVVIVTGAARGVGRGIALEAAREGAKVVVNDLGTALNGDGSDATVAGQVVREIKALGGESVANSDSVASWDSAKKIVQCALDTFGRVDGIVNNAGIFRGAIFHEMNPEDFDLVLDVNLRGPFFVSRAAAPHFKTQNSGVFVHTTSTAGLIGYIGQADYSAAKLGVAGLSKSIAIDMKRYNVSSNCIAPFAFTRMTDSLPKETPEQKKNLERLRLLRPEKIAPFTVALLSEEGRMSVTGQIFGVRNNEILFFSQNRPSRTVHTAEGWTATSVIERVFPMLKPSFYPLDQSSDVISWAPA
jgi:NAD(P)-dependent dehydrogenase (short-subunit alcohol dehydrogenase family)